MARLNSRKFKKTIRSFSVIFEFLKKYLPTKERSEEIGYTSFLLPVDTQRRMQRKNVKKYKENFVSSGIHLTRNYFRNLKLKKYLRPTLALVLVVAFIIQILSPNGNNVLGATYTLTQTNWAGGANTGATGVHPTNDSGYTVYNAASSTIKLVNSSADIQLTTSTVYVTSTDDGTTNTGFNLTGAALSQTTVVNSGDPASVKLAAASSVGGLGADGALTLASSFNINTQTNGNGGRTCADGVAYNVTALTANTATLSSTPAAGCLANGDVVMLVNLQGTQTTITGVVTNYQTGNVGNYEFLNVSSVASNVVTFSSNKTKYYGTNTSTDDINLGVATNTQRVVLQRVPQYTNVTINNGGKLTANPWDGQKGGVLVLYANGTVLTNAGGSIDMASSGYRGYGSTAGATYGYQGESIDGLGNKGPSASGPKNGGGVGAYDDGMSCGDAAGGGGYGTAGGSKIFSYSCNATGGPGGSTYGNSSLTKMFLGSAGGGSPSFANLAGGKGGGLVYINANTISFGSGTVNVNGGSATDVSGGSGGSLFLNGNTVTVGSNVTATGGVTSAGVDVGGGNGGSGRIYIAANSVVGTTNPAATTGGLATTYYSSGTYTSGWINVPAVTWRTLSYNTTTQANTAVSIKARSWTNSTTAWSSCTAIASGANLSTGGCVTNGDQYIQYQASLSTTDTSVSPSLNSVTIGYDSYDSSGQLISVPYDSGDATNVMGSVAWDEDTSLPSGTTVTVSIRTANNSAMTGATAWQDFTNATAGCTKSTASVSCPYATIGASLKDGSNDRYFQYKVNLSSTGTGTPTFSEARIQFVINAPPEVQLVTATQNSDGTVTISYQVRSVDTATDTGSVGVITPSFQYCAGGTSCSNISALSAGATSTKAVNVDGVTWNSYSLTWTPTTDRPNVYDAAAKIRVTADDLQGANRYGYGTSTAFVLDTAAPTSISMHIDASSTPARITLAASDTSTPVQMRFGTSLGTLAAAAYEAFAASKTMSLSDPTTLYVQFKDAYSNESSPISVTTPGTPTNIIAQDISNMLNTPPDYREFVAWKVVDLPSLGFGAYKIYRSTDAAEPRNWTLLYSITDRTINYYADSTVPSGVDVYYKVLTADAQGNVSFNSAVIRGRADGVQNLGEGGGGTNGVGPVISHIATSTVAASSIHVTWDTDTLSNSTVSYSTVPGVFGNAVTVASMVNTSTGAGQHEVILANLLPNTTYYFQVRSQDINSNFTIDNNGGNGYVFNTTDGPTITAGPTVTAAYNTSAVITWQTNIPANSTIFYSTSSDFAAASSVSDLVTYNTTHSLTLTSLATSTQYFYYVRSMDGSGNIAFDQNVVNGVAQYFTFYTTNDVTNPTFSNYNAAVNTTTAVVSWRTNKLADTRINFGLTAGYGSSTYDSFLTTAHSVTLPNLIPNSTYHYQVVGTDANGNQGSSGDQTFLTGTPIDTTPPVIINVTTSSVAINRATIIWNTNKNTNATVDVGTSTTYGSLFGLLYDYSTSTHSVNLTSLLGNTLYYFRVNSADVNGNSASSTGSFITVPDVTPPVVVASSTLVNDTAAFINWETDEQTVAYVNYGTDQNLLDSQVAVTSTFYISHSLPIAGLTPLTLYYYQIVTADYSANTTTLPVQTFTTLAAGQQTVTVTKIVDNTKYTDTSLPTISNLAVTPVTPFSVNITWTTDKDSSSLVKYGQTTNYGSLAGDEETMTQSHSVPLVNLNPATTYHFKAKSIDKYGNVGAGDDLTFTTLNVDGTAAKPSEQPQTSEEEKQAALDKLVVDRIKQAPAKIILSILDAMTNNPFLKELTDNQAVKAFSDLASQIGTAPIIVGLRPTVEVHGNAATIRWSTDKKTSGVVSFAKESEYAAGTDKPYTTSIVDVDNISTTHTVELNSLAPATRYHFQVSSKGEIGPEAKSNDFNFETEAVLPEISDAKVTDVAATEATVSWKTNVPTASDLRFTNVSSTKSLTAGDPALLITHTFTLRNLDPGSKYSLTIKAKNESGQEASSTPLTFETIIDKEAPVISNVAANSTIYPGSASKVQTIISWETNELAESQLFYQEGVGDTDNIKSMPLETSFTNKHFIVLTGFKSGAVYKYWIESTDQSGNKGTSEKFTTLTPTEKQTIIDIITNNFQSVFGWTKNVGL